MRTPDQILGQIKARYHNSWRAWLASSPGELTFPLSPPSAHTIAHDALSVQSWLHAWRSWADEHPTVHMRTASRRTVIGHQKIYTHVTFPDVDALIGVDSVLAGHWHVATRRYAALSDCAVSQERLKSYLAQIVDLSSDDFDLLIRVAQWFAANPTSGLTIRQVPIFGMHTKWLAQHRSLVLALLGVETKGNPVLDEPGDDSLGARELDVLGLRPLPANIDIILADTNDQRSLGGLRHIRAPLEEIARLSLRPRHVLVIENKQSALPIPNWRGVLVIHSLGNFLDALTLIPWIATAQTWYWGDLDRAGFTLLSRARTRRPDITSLLMDGSTLHQHVALAVTDPTGRVDPPDPTLTTAERETLVALADQKRQLRLEQERIPWNHVLHVLEKFLT